MKPFVMVEAISGKAFFDALNSRDFHRMEELLLADAKLLFPKTQPLIGRDRIIKFLRLLFRQYPRLVFSVQHIIRQENLMAVHWSNHGENRHGEPYENEGVTLLEIQDNRIGFISDFFKNTEKF